MIDADKADAMLTSLLNLPEIADWGGVMIPRELSDAVLHGRGSTAHPAVVLVRSADTDAVYVASRVDTHYRYATVDEMLCGGMSVADVRKALFCHPFEPVCSRRLPGGVG